ncbi:hypothetical protein Bbelb_291880 [Branchiostoma belcheri]|nr:hypothetical protein Bbelb_291880 [Branchiostoma belcheri]
MSEVMSVMAVRQYLIEVKAEQANAIIQPTQAQPVFVEKLTATGPLTWDVVSKSEELAWLPNEEGVIQPHFREDSTGRDGKRVPHPGRRKEVDVPNIEVRTLSGLARRFLSFPHYRAWNSNPTLNVRRFK